MFILLMVIYSYLDQIQTKNKGTLVFVVVCSVQKNGDVWYTVGHLYNATFMDVQ